MANLKNTSINDAQFRLPVGDTAARPGSPNARQIRFNTETGKLEQFRPGVGDWIAPNNTGVIATGGDSVYDVDVEGTTYRVHVFTSTGTSTFNVLQGGEAEYLIVAGGGGAGGNQYHNGGGGAGGLLSGITTAITQAYTITVGAGGAPGANRQRGNQGQNSSAFDLVSIGGGSGGNYYDQNGGSGGSGGGAGGRNGTNRTGGSGTVGQGNDGGNSNENNAGGGGGAGAVGENGSDSQNFGGSGGIGISSNITGMQTFYAGGGGAAGFGSETPGTGGLGGGGDGNNTTGNPGVPNTGGGAGAPERDSSTNLGAGGSGIVIIRYPLRQENPVTAPGRDVQDGLVLDLDFAKPTVYSGSGSVVTDGRLNGIEGNINGASFVNTRTHRSAFDFDGSDDEINFGNVAGDFSNITVTVWFKPFRVQNYENVLDCNYSNYSSGNVGPRLEMSSDERLTWLISGDTDNNNNNNSVNVVSNLSSNVWVSSSLTYNGSVIKTYLNGELQNQENSTTGFVDAVGDLRIGRGFGRAAPSGRSMQGEVSLVRLYNYALSENEIQVLYDYNRWRFGV